MTQIQNDVADPRYGIAWQGAVEALHSLALVNRAICSRLARRGHRVTLVPPGGGEMASGALAGLPELHRGADGAVDCFVGHQWPPDFRRPASGPWVVMQPWEFGSIPTAWLEPLRRDVDELWVNCRFVRDCYVAAGVPPSKVHVIPLGVDAEAFAAKEGSAVGILANSATRKWRQGFAVAEFARIPTASNNGYARGGPLSFGLRTTKRFRFLFVGGTLYRKGFDALLAAYGRAFCDRDDVCLVVKDMGVGTFYCGQTGQGLIAEHRARAGAAEVEYLSAELTEAELRGLYAACHCLAQPYRGEGFCLPLVEAMASGLPVIVTGYGPALDFCCDETAYLVPYQLVRFQQKRVGELETVDHPWLAEPDGDALVQLLRRAYEERAEGVAKGRAGREFVLGNFTWDHTVLAIERRLGAIIQEGRDRNPVLPGTVGRDSYPVRLRETGRDRNPVLRERVSVCMIVKNEEGNIAECIGPVMGIVDEVVVIDTGSTDRTVEIARGLGARVIHFPWVDSSAAARNESLRYAAGEWVLWLDADDRIDGENLTRLRVLLANLTDENVGFVMKCHCLPDPVSRRSTTVDHVRLFRRHPGLRWRYRVHEQILGSLRELGADVRWSDVVIQHTGYQDPALRQRKLQRDLRLLMLEQAENGGDPFVLFNLGMILHELHRPGEALGYLCASLRQSHPSDSIVRKLYALISQCHRQLSQKEEALASCREGRRHYPFDVELLFHESVVLKEMGDPSGSEACLLHLLFAKEGEHFASVNPALRAIARHNLAVLCREQGRDGEAESHWQGAVDEGTDPMPCWVGLGELYLSQQRWDDLDNALAWLDTDDRYAIDAAVLRSRALMARRELMAARQCLEHVIAREPGALLPRLVLSRVLLQEDRDLPAAEHALRAVLSLCPDHAEARHNLAVLMQRSGTDAHSHISAG